MSIGLDFEDVPDDLEAGYSTRVSPEFKSRWQKNHTCDKCGQLIKRVTRSFDGQGIAIDMVPTAKGKWLYRRQPDGTYAQQGSGKGHSRHYCTGGES